MNQQSKWVNVLEQLSDETLSKTDSAVFKQYKKSLKEIKIEVKRYIKEYDQLSFSKRLEAERLLNVGTKLDSILKENNKQVTKFIKDGSMQHAVNGYNATYYALEGANKLNLSMSMLNEAYIEKLVNKPVSGKRFSTRLYQNTKRLAKTTTQSLIQGAIDGKGYAYVAKRITEQTEADYRRAMRIARTEGGRVQSETTQRAYKEAKEQGVNLQKQWLASLDDKTRSSHASLDGTTIDVDDYFESGETGAQALGPRMFGVPEEDINCRCTTISIVDGYKPALRYDKEIGKNIHNMSYTEWLSFKSKATASSDQVISLKDTFSARKIMGKTNMKASVGEKNYDQFVTHLDGIEDKQVKEVYNKYGNNITYTKMSRGGCYAKSNNVTLGQTAFDGDGIGKLPLSVVYHENGHAIDSLGLKKLTGKSRFATGKKVKIRYRGMTSEVDEYITHASALPKYDIKNKLSDDIWKYINGDLETVKSLGKRPRKKLEKLAWDEKRSLISRENYKNSRSFIESIKDTPNAAPLSDILESTGMFGARPLRYGHGSSYWSQKGMIETEFFANFSQAQATDPEMAGLIRKIFPKATQAYDELINDMLKEVVD